MKLKRGYCVFWYFFYIDLCSTTPMESSHRDLLNGMAEHRPILKNNQNTHHQRFASHSKQVWNSPTGFCFYCELWVFTTRITINPSSNETNNYGILNKMKGVATTPKLTKRIAIIIVVYWKLDWGRTQVETGTFKIWSVPPKPSTNPRQSEHTFCISDFLTTHKKCRLRLRYALRAIGLPSNDKDAEKKPMDLAKLTNFYRLIQPRHSSLYPWKNISLGAFIACTNAHNPKSPWN